MKQPCQKWQGCLCYGSRKDAGGMHREEGMPDKSLGRSIAPRGSSRSNCQVKAILHGGIGTGAEMRGRHRGSGEGYRGAEREGHRGAERRGTEERNGGAQRSGTRGFLL